MKETLQSVYGEMLDSYPQYVLRIREEKAPNGAYVIYSDDRISADQITASVDQWQVAPTDSQGYHVVDLRPDSEDQLLKSK
jgi:hypothetical protein